VGVDRAVDLKSTVAIVIEIRYLRYEPAPRYQMKVIHPSLITDWEQNLYFMNIYL